VSCVWTDCLKGTRQTHGRRPFTARQPWTCT